MSTSNTDSTFLQPYSSGRSSRKKAWDQNVNNIDDSNTNPVQNEVDALFRCNACFIKFTEEEALEDHILALHSSGSPDIEAEDVNERKNEMETKYPVTHNIETKQSELPVSYGAKIKSNISDSDKIDQQAFSEHNDKAQITPNKMLLKISNLDRVTIGPPVLHTKLTAERKFKFSLCGKTFTRKESLQYHFMCHTGEKPFKCVFSVKQLSGQNQRLEIISKLFTVIRLYCKITS